MVTTVENGECANKRFDGTPAPCGVFTLLPCSASRRLLDPVDRDIVVRACTNA